MSNAKPLEGVRVIEMSTYVAAPVAAKMLADWGAEVIKVEPISGDVYRIIGRTLRMPVGEKYNPCFDLENANKKGFALNLKTKEGQDILRNLLKTANALITNYRPDAQEKLKLTYEEISKEFPSLVYGIVTGYGDKGPDKDKPGYDLTAFLARSGMMLDSVDKNGAPMSVLAAVGDHITGASLASGVCAALYKQKATGKGDKVTVGLYQTALFAYSSMISGTYHDLKYPIDRFTSPSPIVNSYKCKDGEWLLLAATNFDADWKKVCVEVLGRQDLAENPDYQGVMNMIKNTSKMVGILDEIFLTKDRDEWCKLLDKADVANEKILHFKDVLKDKQAWDNNYLREVEYENGEKSVLVNTPVTFNSVGEPAYKRAPEIGEDNQSILESLGYSDDEIKKLKEDGFIS